MNNYMLQDMKGDTITFVAVFKNQFKNWNLKDQIFLTPEQVDHIDIKDITKVKIYNEQPVEGHYMLKIEETKAEEINQNHYAVSLENLKTFFEKLLIFKLKNLGLQFDPAQNFQTQLSGKCYKKSQIRGKWQERHIRISKETGLTSKKPQKQKESLHIKQSKEIWSRFQVMEIQKQTYLVIKVKYLLGKQQFAVPVKECGKWVKAFYSLFYS